VKKTRLAAAALVALIVVALASPTSYARSNATIKLGAICDLSGPTSDVGTGYCRGETGFVEWFNKKGGFSNKATIDMEAQDFGYNVAKASQLYSQISAQNPAAFLGWGTADTSALTARITADKIPFLSASYAEQLTDPKDTPYNFVVGTNYTAQAQIAAKYIAKDKKHHEIAFFHNNSAFGTAPIQGLKDYIKTKNLDIDVKTYPMISGTTAFDAQLLQAQAQKADYIFLQNVPTPPSILAKDVKRLGIKAKLVCLNYCASEVFVKLAGDAANGVLGVQPWTPVSFKVPGDKIPDAYLKSKGSSLEKEGLTFLQGWYTMALLSQAIETVIKKGQPVNGPNIKTALETMPAFTTGLVSDPIKFSASGNYGHDGMKGSRIYEIKNGKFVKLTGFTKP